MAGRAQGVLVEAADTVVMVEAAIAGPVTGEAVGAVTQAEVTAVGIEAAAAQHLF